MTNSIPYGNDMFPTTCNANENYRAGRNRGAGKWMSSVRLMSAVISILIASQFPAYAASGDGTFLVAKRSISQPPGFNGLCSKYRWVCARTAQSTLSHSAVLSLAQKVNKQINRRTRQIDDQVQYGREEYWTLPTKRGGDCEDLVLLKKKMLIERGIASQDLLIATVLDRKLRSHAVLVFRTKNGDLVLDSLTSRIMPWKKTGYTFLKMQNPRSPGKWEAVLAGGLIKDKPTASR